MREEIEKMLPSADIKLHYQHFKLFYETMYERMQIWKRRFVDKQPYPWTENKILRDYKFTNVYRELDRSSQWQINNIMLKEDPEDLRNFVWKVMIYRMFNNPDSFQWIQDNKGWSGGIPDYTDYNEEEFYNTIKELRANGMNPFTNAYLLMSGTKHGGSRDDFYVYGGIRDLRNLIDNGMIGKIQKAKDPEEIIKMLCSMTTVASFIAHEYYQDFTYIPIYTGKKFMPFDQNDFTNVGPGASLGIRLIFPNLSTKEQKQAIYDLRDMAEVQLERVAKKNNGFVPYVHWDRKQNCYVIDGKCNITLHQIEMWLCEFSKYWKMITKIGKQRSRYVSK